MAVDFSTIGKSAEYLAAQEAAESESSSATLDQSDFLELLTTQLSAQDPTDPVDTDSMVTTMAQLSMIEYLDSIDTQMSDIVESVDASSALTATSLVGYSVLVDTDECFFDGYNNCYIQIDAGDYSSNLSITITNSSGEVVAEYTATEGSGDMTFSWDGIESQTVDEDGVITTNYYDSGMYTFTVTATQDGETVQLDVKSYALVQSVTLGSSPDTTILNLLGYGDILLSEVEEISC